MSVSMPHLRLGLCTGSGVQELDNCIDVTQLGRDVERVAASLKWWRKG